jgi:hypothetical protein
MLSDGCLLWVAVRAARPEGGVTGLIKRDFPQRITGACPCILGRLPSAAWSPLLPGVTLSRISLISSPSSGGPFLVDIHTPHDADRIPESNDTCGGLQKKPNAAASDAAFCLFKTWLNPVWAGTLRGAVNTRTCACAPSRTVAGFEGEWVSNVRRARRDWRK